MRQEKTQNTETKSFLTNAMSFFAISFAKFPGAKTFSRHIILLILLSSPLFLNGQGRLQNRIRYRVSNKISYLYLNDVANYYGMKYTVSGKKVILSSKYSNLSFTINSRLFKFNGIETNLSYGILQFGKQALLARTDFEHFIDPILRKQTISKRKVRHIMIDPGHGGKDPGAQSQGVSEKNLNLVYSRRIAAILRKRGYRVTMTRTQDRLLTLSQRSAIAKRHKPDVFLSIHCNAAADAKINGIETYIINPAQTPSSGGNVVAKKAAPGNSYNLQNALLGFTLHKNLITASAAKDRGLKRKQFYVIREVSCPAALLELGFITNAAERKNLLNPRYQDKVSVAVCDAIQEFEKHLLPN